MSFSLESYFILSYTLLFYVEQRNSLTLRASVLRNFLGISQHFFSFLFLSARLGIETTHRFQQFPIAEF